MHAPSNLPDRYTIQSTLGEGGFGVVYKAFDRELKREVAIKILSNISTASKSSLKKEFETLYKLNHPHLVRVYGYGFISDDIPYFTMEYIEGDDLRTFLAKSGAIQQLPTIIDQTFQALSHLHEREIIHSDIKPDNIFVSIDKNETVSTKLLDFGLVSTVQEKSTQTSGTPRFIAPEVLSKQNYSPASDLYSLGMTLIESNISRQVPNALEIDATFNKRIQKELSGILSSNDILNPSAVASFIVDLVQFSPEDRPANASDAAQKFKVILDVSSQDIISKIDNVFINRARELSIINEFLTTNIPNNHILILNGPTGIGKKRIIQKAISLAQPEGYFVIDLSRESFTNNTLKQFADTISSNLTPVKRNKFLERHKKILQLVKSQTELEQRVIDTTRVAYSNMVKYLQEIASHNPTLVCIPDIERFSEDFHRFIDQLTHELSLNPNNEIIFIISINSDLPMSKQLAHIIDNYAIKNYSQQLYFRIFMHEDLEKLQSILFDRSLFNKHQIDNILRETDGIPLLIIEFIKHLIGSNVIMFENGIWHLDQSMYDETLVPSSITDFIQEKYSKLNSRQKDTLQMMAHWGRTISRSTIFNLLNSSRYNINEIINELLDCILIENNINNSLSFPHAAYIKFIKNNTTKGKAQMINARILQYLENTGSDCYERLAHHSIDATLTEKALIYTSRAVDLLEQVFNYFKCYELLTKLKSLMVMHGNKEQIISVLKRISPIELIIGMTNIALKDYLALLDYSSDYADKAIYSKAIANIHHNYIGNYEEAENTLNIAMKYAKKCNDPLIIAQLLLELSMIKKENRDSRRKKAAELTKYVDKGIYAKILAYLLRANIQAGKHVEAQNIERELNKLLNEVILIYKPYIYSGLYSSSFYTGDYNKAEYCTQQNIKIYTELCDEIGIIDNYNALGGIYYIQGLYYDQIKALKTAINSMQKYSAYDTSFYLSNLSLAYRCVADYRQAYLALERALSFYDHLTGKHASEWALSKYVYAYSLMGDIEYDNFNKYYKKTMTVAKRTNNIIIIGHTIFAKSLFYFQRHKYSISNTNVNRALQMFRSVNDRDDIIDALRLLTMILIEKEDFKEASKAAAEAREIFDEIHCDYLKPQLLLAEGALARAQHSNTAEAKLKEALKTSKKMFTREYTWQIQRELALYHKDKGELHKALQHYRDAIDMIKEITETIDGEELKTSYLSLPFRKRVFDEIKGLKKQLN